MKRPHLRLLSGLLCTVLAVVLMFGHVAQANQVSRAQIEQRRQALLQVLLRHPDNLDASFEYAALSSQVGDLEAAVSTLERMLIYSPGLPRVQLELGVLYYRLGSFETSRNYFQAAVSGSDVPDVVRAKVNQYLVAINEQLNPNKFSATTLVGIRWQSNANSAPNSANVTLNGLPFELNNNFTSQPDFSAFISSTAHYSHQFRGQGDRFEVDYTGFSDAHFQESQVDVNVAELTAGPSFNLARFGIDDAYMSGYAILGGALLDRKEYYGSVGAGSRLVKQWNTTAQSSLRAEYRHYWFNNTEDLPTLSDNNGDEYRLTGDTAFLITPKVRLTVGGRFAYMDARRSFNDYFEVGPQASLSVVIDAPALAPDLPWTANVFAGYLYRKFRQPDPTISATERERDNEFWVAGNMIIPFSNRFALVPQVEYRKVSSNYDIKEFDAFTAFLALAVAW